jgi:hypothetical protein
MKKLQFNNMVMKSCMAFVYAVLLCGLSTSCSKDDDDSNDESKHRRTATTFDDFAFFQDTFIDVDSLGNFLHRSIGQPLPTLDSDTTHLFVGVETIEEALKYFDMSLAPDIERSVSSTPNYTYMLTDVNGQEQGTVSFAPGTEDKHVAEITTNIPALKHFSRITFLENGAWPYKFNSGRYKLGDGRKENIEVVYWDGWRRTKNYTQKFVCIREKGNGVKPLYVGLTDDFLDARDLRVTSDYCPKPGVASQIANITKKDFDFFKACFSAAGMSLDSGWLYWINDIQLGFLTTDCGCICLSDGTIDYWDIYWQTPKKRIVMKIDWEDD